MIEGKPVAVQIRIRDILNTTDLLYNQHSLCYLVLLFYSVIVPPTLCVRVLSYTFCSFSYLSALSVLSYLLIIIRTNDIQNIHHTPARTLVRTYLCTKLPRRPATYPLFYFSPCDVLFCLYF